MHEIESLRVLNQSCHNGLYAGGDKPEHGRNNATANLRQRRRHRRMLREHSSRGKRRDNRNHDQRLSRDGVSATKAAITIDNCVIAGNQAAVVGG
jgi:hypothetical protein